MIHADLLVSYNGPMGGSRGVDRVASHPGAFSRGVERGGWPPRLFRKKISLSLKKDKLIKRNIKQGMEINVWPIETDN